MHGRTHVINIWPSASPRNHVSCQQKVKLVIDGAVQFSRSRRPHSTVRTFRYRHMDTARLAQPSWNYYADVIQQWFPKKAPSCSEDNVFSETEVRVDCLVEADIESEKDIEYVENIKISWRLSLTKSPLFLVGNLLLISFLSNSIFGNRFQIFMCKCVVSSTVPLKQEAVERGHHPHPEMTWIKKLLVRIMYLFRDNLPFMPHEASI